MKNLLQKKQEPQKPIIVARPKIKINETLTIMQLADKLNVKAIDLIKNCCPAE